MRRVIAICLLISVLLLAHPALDAWSAYRAGPVSDSPAYTLTDARLTDRVVLVVIDSWAARIMETPAWMPKLFARSRHGAFGVLWAPKQTETMQGILTLSTGVPPSGLSAIGLISSARYDHWTIFDDIKASGRSVMFSGGPAWAPLFGDRGTDNFRETGHGPQYRQDDVEGLTHLEQALLSASPPALSVLHISETDFAAHQFGTTRPAYAEVLRFWDDTLDSFFTRIAAPGTTVIVTADHGNDLNGSHGGSDPIYRRVPVLMWGTGIVAGRGIEMQASDMPATIAVLLGVRAPAAALGMPAVEAMDVSEEERERIQTQAYEQAVLRNPRVSGNSLLLARARDALERAGSAEANVHDRTGAGSLRQAMLALEPELSPVRDWRLIDWVLAALTFAAALGLGRLTWNRVVARKPISLGYGIVWVIAFVLTEGLLWARVTLPGSIKHELRNPHTTTVLAACVAVLLAIAGVVYAKRHRDVIIASIKSHAVTCIVVLYLLFTVVRPFDTLGLLGITMIAAFAYGSSWPLAVRVVVTGAFAVYFAVGDNLLWPMFGERIAPRYWIAAPVTVAGVLTWALLQRKYPAESTRLKYAQLSSLAMLLILLPAGGLGLTGWSAANVTPLASGLLILFCSWTRVIGRPPWWGWLGPLTVLAFWWFPESPLFTLYLSVGALLVVFALSNYRGRTDFRVGAFMVLVSMLLLLTTPAKAISLFLLMSVLIAFVESTGTRTRRRGTPDNGDVLVFAALFIVACRYAMFDLFGNSDSSLLFGLQNLDIHSAYIGNSRRDIVPAILMALFKIWLAGTVLFAVLGLFKQWRPWLVGVAGMAGMFTLLNVAQTSVIAALATGPRSDQYAWAAFSVFTNAGILLFAMLSFAVFAAFGAHTSSEEPNPAPPLPSATL
jgi:Type I phosphodiesterase / nucleotide pyrophosphatase